MPTQSLAPPQPPRVDLSAGTAGPATDAGTSGLTAAALCVSGLVLALLGATTHADHDMFHQMALFREALRLGEMPVIDLFAYTPTVSPSYHHEWGTGAVLYGVAVASGLGGTGVMLLKYLLLAGLVAAAAACGRRRGASSMALLATAPFSAGLLLLALHTVRAQLFTLVFVALLLLLLESDRRGSRRWIVAWLAVFPLWINLHGGFVAGLGLFGLHAAERFAATTSTEGLRAAFERTWHLIAGGVGMVLLVGLNPYGWAYVPNLLHAIGMERPNITEWRPLVDSGPPAVVVFAGSLLLAAYGLHSRRLRRAEGITLLLVAAALAWAHVRHTSIYGVVWLAYVPAWLTGTTAAVHVRRAWSRFAPAATGMGVAAAVFGAAFFWTQRGWELRVPTTLTDGSRVYPAGAVAHLRNVGFRGNLMTPFQVGAYVSWHLHPAVKVSLDSRYEAAYAPGVLETHRTAYLGHPGWDRAVAGYPTGAILVRRDAKLFTLLEHNGPALPGRWRRVYDDGAYAVFASASTVIGPPARNTPGWQSRHGFLESAPRLPLGS